MKRIWGFLLGAVLLLAASGCASIFNKEYYSSGDYVTGQGGDDFVGSTEIDSYEALKSAILRMVNSYETQGALVFSSYEGSITEDIAQACWEVKADTSLGAYCIDYMSYDLRRIVSYYQMELYITYTRTAEQVASIVTVSNAASLKAHLAQVMGEFGKSAVVRVAATVADAEAVSDLVSEIYYASPLSIVLLPKVTAEVFSGSGPDRIFEITFDYGRTPQALQIMRTELQSVVTSMAALISETAPEMTALRAFQALAGHCEYDPDGALRLETLGKDSGLGSTAYGALVEELADSRGMALAYAALCQTLEIPCLVVSGKLDKADHAWNLINLDGEYYHADLSQYGASGVLGAFLRSDADMSGRYWWDISLYPASEGPLTHESMYQTAGLEDPETEKAE